MKQKETERKQKIQFQTDCQFSSEEFILPNWAFVSLFSLCFLSDFYCFEFWSISSPVLSFMKNTFGFIHSYRFDYTISYTIPFNSLFNILHHDSFEFYLFSKFLTTNGIVNLPYVTIVVKTAAKQQIFPFVVFYLLFPFFFFFFWFLAMFLQAQYNPKQKPSPSFLV